MKLSTWTVEGRRDRWKKDFSGEKIAILKSKRIRQLHNLIKKYKTSSLHSARVRRWTEKAFSLIQTKGGE